MKERIRMNSQSLQEKFPEVYREFFSKCPIVVSAPGNFYWTGEYSVLYGGLAIKQNLPLRVYVGLEPSHGIKFGQTKIYVPSKARFESRPIPNIMGERVIEFLENQLPKNNHGFIIHIIYEVPVGCGLAASSAFAAALATAIKIQNNSKILKDLEKNREIKIKDCLNNRLFNELFRFAWKIDNLFHNKTSSGAGPFASLVNSNFPVVYFSEKWGGREEKNTDEYKVWGFRIDELVNSEGQQVINLEDMTNWPIDFGLVYTGDAGSTEASIQSTKLINWLHSDINSRWKKIFKNLKIEKNKPLFYDLTKEKEEDDLLIFMKALTKVSLETLWSLTTVLRYGFSDEDFRFLFRAVNRNQDLLRVLQVSSPFLDKVCNQFLIESAKGTGIGGGAKLTGAGKRGDVLFVVSFHGMRDHIEKFLDDISNLIGEENYLDYASWLDGTEPEGVKIEQFLQKKINSKFVSEGSMMLKSWDNGGRVTTELLSLEDFKAKKRTIDLLFDNNGDVLILGKKLSSKDIPSSSSTVKILNILLENLGKEIANDKLPESSYSLDRNEMQSKIVSPLRKVLKTKIGKDLPLEISGGLTDFKICLQPSNLNIKVLNKI
jgi:mevalonate kinase